MMTTHEKMIDTSWSVPKMAAMAPTVTSELDTVAMMASRQPTL